MRSLQKKQSKKDFTTIEELKKIDEVYDSLNDKAALIDKSLIQHIKALQVNTRKRLEILEKKLFRAERQNYESLNRQIAKLKNELFPKEGLQERIENFLPFYAKYGKSFIQKIVDHSPDISTEFIIIKEETE